MTDAEQLKVISYGGGVQSTALVLLAMDGVIDFDVALFANVGDDSEHPATLEWVRGVMAPLMEDADFPLHELRRITRWGKEETLWQLLTRENMRSVQIPMRMQNGAPGRRQCTGTFKMKVIGRWLRAHGASEDNPAKVAVGISTDEFHRANRKRSEGYEIAEYPLLDLKMSRKDCLDYIQERLGAVPPKSSCFFCPYKRPAEWEEMRRDEPELFDKAVFLEKSLNGRRAAMGRDDLYMTRFGKPLDIAITAKQEAIPGLDITIGDDGCDSGHCWT